MSFQFEPRRHCQNLRCKEMYTATARDPEQEAVTLELYGRGSSPAFWCRVTQTARGPDGGRVNDEGCDRGRSCFLGIEDLR